MAVAVLETVNPSVPVEGPDLRIGTAGAARDAAGRNGAGPVFQQAGITSYDITLKPGSNLIPLTLMPDDTAIEAVLVGILDRVETVWQYDTSGPDPKWRSHAPGAPSDLAVMRDGPGYWVHLKDDGTGDEALTITGGDASGPARRVVQGWNLVGFTATSPQAPGEYLGALSGSAGTTMGYAGGAAATVLPSADPPLLMPGQGYWLYLEAAGTDRAALVALYNATDGANWRNNGNWLSNGPHGGMAWSNHRQRRPGHSSGPPTQPVDRGDTGGVGGPVQPDRAVAHQQPADRGDTGLSGLCLRTPERVWTSAPGSGARTETATR